MAGLLDPLTDDQQWLVDLVAEAVCADGQWPFFDYIEGRFDHARKDAWETLYSFPRQGQWNYASVWWASINQPLRPSGDTEIELTVLGIHHSKHLSSYRDLFVETLQVMVERLRSGPLSRRSVRNASITPPDLNDSNARRVPWQRDDLAFVPKLLAREPATWGGGISVLPDGEWEKGIPRSVLDYEGVSSFAEYIERLEVLTAPPEQPRPNAVASPLGIVAALDYLDTAWRLSFRKPLFTYPSAERAARLAFPATTAEEFDSRLSGLGEILRSANVGARNVSSRKLERASHDEPLATFRDLMVELAANESGRVAGAINVLEAAIAIRDAAQHTEASPRAVRALTRVFALPHPIGDPTTSWAAVGTRAVDALTALREVLATRDSDDEV